MTLVQQDLETGPMMALSDHHQDISSDSTLTLCQQQTTIMSLNHRQDMHNAKSDYANGVPGINGLTDNFNINSNMKSDELTQNNSHPVIEVVKNEEIVMNQTEEEQPEVDIVISNVVCSFSVRCHLNLRQIALNGANVEYRRENGMVTMKLRRPYTTASIWSSGKITCTGATSETASKIAARRFARCLQKLGFKTRFTNFRIVNVLGICSMPFHIKIINFSAKYREAEYEPELHPGVTFKIKRLRATLKIFSTGSITVTAPSVAAVQEAIEEIYPLVYEFHTIKPPRPNNNSDSTSERHYNRAKKRKRNNQPEDNFSLHTNVNDSNKVGNQASSASDSDN